MAPAWAWWHFLGHPRGSYQAKPSSAKELEGKLAEGLLQDKPVAKELLDKPTAEGLQGKLAAVASSKRGLQPSFKVPKPLQRRRIQEPRLQEQRRLGQLQRAGSWQGAGIRSTREPSLEE